MILKLQIKTICLLLLSMLAQPLILILRQENAICLVQAATNNTTTENKTGVNNLSQADANSSDEHLPFMKEDNQNSSPITGFGLLVRTVGALVVILGLLVAGTWLMRRSSGIQLKSSNTEAPLVVVSTTNIGDKQSLSVVKFGTKTLLIGASGQGMKVLASEKSSEDQVSEEVINDACSVKDLLDVGEIAERYKLLKY